MEDDRLEVVIIRIFTPVQRVVNVVAVRIVGWTPLLILDYILRHHVPLEVACNSRVSSLTTVSLHHPLASTYMSYCCVSILCAFSAMIIPSHVELPRT